MRFNRRSTAEVVTEDLDLTGKTIVITGVNSGLGFESMRILAQRGAHVIGLARTVAKAEEACANVEGETTGLACELSDLESVAACARQIRDMGMPIDVLMFLSMSPSNAILEPSTGIGCIMIGAGILGVVGLSGSISL